MKIKNFFNKLNNKDWKTINTGITIVPTMNSKIKPENTAWIGTFQLVWNDFMDNEIKGVVEFEKGNNKTVNDLNRQDFTKNDISKEAYYIKSGTICPKLKEEIENALMEKFCETSETLSDKDFVPQPLAKLFYAMLKKDFKFKEKFDSLCDDIFYADNNLENNKNCNSEVGLIKYFGIDFDSKQSLFENVSVLFYDNDDEYAIKLHTKNNDEVILYRSNKFKQFDIAFEDLNKKSETYSGSNYFVEHDFLKIPVLDFKSETSFSDVENKVIKNSNGLQITKTIEVLLFKMDECGVVLKSEVAMEIVFLGSPSIRQTRKFLFDKPFTMFLKEKDKQAPYFAMYVADATKLNK